MNPSLNYQDIRLNEGFIISQKHAVLIDHELHTHDQLEVSIVLNRTIRYKQLKQDYYGHAGDVFLYRPFEPHWTLTAQEEYPAEWIMLLFSPSLVNLLPVGNHLLAPFYAVHHSPLIPASSEAASLIREATLLAVEEQQKRRPGWESRRLLYLMDILVLIYRHDVELYSESTVDTSPIDEIIHVIHYITAHLEERIVLEQLVNKTSLKKTRFYQLFREVTGISPNQFINRIRLQNAIHQLIYSELTISDIAYDCGFETLSYFNRCFKHYTGASPREFRKQRTSTDV